MSLRSPILSITTSACNAILIASAKPALLSPSMSQPCANNKLVVAPTLFCTPSHWETIKLESTPGISISQNPLFCFNGFTKGPIKAIVFTCLDKGNKLFSFFKSTMLFAAIERAAAV